MGTMREHINMVHTIAIARAARMAYVAGMAIGEGKTIDRAIELGRAGIEVEFAAVEPSTSDGRFYEEMQDSVEKFIRMLNAPTPV